MPVPAAGGAPRGAVQPGMSGSGVQCCASVLPLPFHVPRCPLCFLALFLPLGGAVLSPAGALHPPPAVWGSPHPAGPQGWMCLSLPWQGPLWDKGLVPAVCQVTCCGTVLLVFLATPSLW